MTHPLIAAAVLWIAHAAGAAELPTGRAPRLDSPERYHVVWDSPSADHRGSMPLGNGDVSANAWIEPSGQLVFYIGKTDSWGDNARLKKVGKVRVTLEPAPRIAPFRQELALSEGTMNVQYGDGTRLRVWVDANRPVVHVDIESDRPTTATAAIELWRTEPYELPSIEVSDVMRDRGSPGGMRGPTVVEPDTILTGQTDRIGWYHHNIKSVGPEIHAAIQGMTGYQRDDPLLHRTFGAMITTERAHRLDDARLQSAGGARHRFAVYVLTLHPSSPEEWLAVMDQLIRESAEPDFEAHKTWWAEFWNRSWIHATAVQNRLRAPANDLPLRVGIDQNGRHTFAGEIRNAELADRFDGDFTLEAEVKADARPGGRIFDKITPGGSDGFLLDVLPGNVLRLIVGSNQHTAANVLPSGEWAKVALVAGADGWHVLVNDQPVITAAAGADAALVSQMYALQRFITACAGRGRYPIKFNGSTFTVAHPERPGDADYRCWGPGYWWQNTRLPYYSLCTSGDFDMLEPLWRMYVDELLPYNQYRTRRYFGFDGAAYYPECVTFWGDVFLETYGWTPVEERDCPLQESRWHKWEWVAGPELVWMMLDHYEHTLDEALLEQRILPTAMAVIRFFDQKYETDEQGQLVMHPSQALETWWDCTNPMPEVAGLHAITRRLLALPENLVAAGDRAYWHAFQAKLPPLPTRETPTGRAYAPAKEFANKRNREAPELYCVFPFRLCAFEKDNRDLGLNALKHRWDRGHYGWRQDEIFMAYLGLADEARAGLLDRVTNDYTRGARFPAFWGPGWNWVPCQDHGGVLMKAFQTMLMQTDGNRILLLPAWPEDWDVDFRLHAPHQTVVEGIYRDGKLRQLTVTPEHRKKDVEVVGR